MFKSLSQLSHHAAWRKQMEMILDSAGEGIYGIDLNGRCIFMNKTGASMLGYTPDEVLGRNMHYLMHHSYANRDLMPVCECNIFKAFQQNKGCRVDSEVLWRRDGTSFPAEYASYPIFEEGEVQGAVVTFTDISDRVAAQHARLAAQVELERRVEERTAALSKAHMRMRRLSAHLNTAREQERSRIAREIHDELGSKLTALNLQLNAMKHRAGASAQAPDDLDSMLGLTEEAMHNLRDILQDLRPGLLDHLGLWPALDSLLKDSAKRYGLETCLSVTAPVEAIRFSRHMETTLYRMAQEALNNTVKHARANRFDIEVWHEGNRVLIRMADDGVGADLSSIKSHGFGLMGIEERAWDIGATCKVSSTLGKGMAIDIQLTDVIRQVG